MGETFTAALDEMIVSIEEELKVVKAAKVTLREKA